MNNIIEELENDIRKNFNGNLRMCKMVLFDFLRLRIESEHEYIGYLVEDKALEISDIGTLSKANILKEVKNIDYDDHYFNTLCATEKEHLLKIMFKEVLKKNNIPFSEEMTNKEMFIQLKVHNKDLIKKHFRLRFFKLSDKYSQYEKELWEELKKDFGWTLNVKLVRNF